MRIGNGAWLPPTALASKARTPREPSPRPSTRPGGRASAAERLASEQRQRIVGAMIEAVGEKGYRATSTVEVIERSGVSRKTFYKHFANKQECFLAAYDLLFAGGVRRVERAYREAEGWPESVQAAIEALFAAAIENPGALRLTTVEIGALGPAGIERRERSVAQYERFITEAVQLAPGHGRISEASVRAIVGGLNRILHRRVSQGEHSKLLKLVPDLVRWATSYYPTPPALLRGSRRARRAPAALEGGRAPGTLAPHSLLVQRRGLPRGENSLSRSLVIHSQRERILDAVANLTAVHGYTALKIDEIAEAAALSLQAFYEHFADKEDAFLVAYEIGHAKGLALVERAFFAEEDWRQGIKAALRALLDYLASEPSFAHLALVETLSATERSSDRFYSGVGGYAQMLVPGFEHAAAQARPPAITVEAIVGGVSELCLHHAVQGRISQLPELLPDTTYVALAPFIGAEEAARVASAPITRRATSSRGA